MNVQMFFTIAPSLRGVAGLVQQQAGRAADYCGYSSRLVLLESKNRTAAQVHCTSFRSLLRFRAGVMDEYTGWKPSITLDVRVRDHDHVDQQEREQRGGPER
jgi:hypothetical protein